MKAIIGLGNPEEQHVATRHNVGFRVIDALAAQLKIPLSQSAKLFSAVGKSENVVLVKPQTYMNDSGKAVQAVAHFYKLQPEAILVVHDDLDIPLGMTKFQFGTGPKVHNGLLSIYETLGTKEFWHLRIGVDGRSGDKTLPGKTYILQPFSADEETSIQHVIEEAVQKLLPYTR